MYKTFLLNPLLEFELDTFDRRLKRQFDIRFAGLYPFGEQDPNPKLKIRIQEVPGIHLASSRTIRNLGLPDDLCLFNEQDFVIVRDRKRISIPFLEIGKSPVLDITFETGFPADWLRRYLDGVVAFHLLGFGASLFHAACLVDEDREILIPAWRGTGKTSLALHLLESRALAYKAEDEFVLMETGESYAYTDASHVDLNHLDQFSALTRSYSSWGFLLRSAIAKLILPFFPPTGSISTFLHRGLLGLFVPKVYVKLKDSIPNLRISDNQPDRRVVLHLISQPGLSEPMIEKVDIGTVIDRSIGGMQYERENIYTMYYAFVYATGQRNNTIDNAVGIETEILHHSLEKSICFEVRIPAGNWSENYSRIEQFLLGNL
jgi:hypothetical protein